MDRAAPLLKCAWCCLWQCYSKCGLPTPVPCPREVQKGSVSLIHGGLEFSTAGPSPQLVCEALDPRVESKLLSTRARPFPVGLSPTSPASAACCRHDILSRARRHRAFAYVPSLPAACDVGQAPVYPLRPPSHLTSRTSPAG